MKMEQICTALPFENGASPSWSRGNSPIVRVGSRVFATNSRVHPERKPLNRTTLEIWEKPDGEDWRMVYEDPEVFQREPCPIACLDGNRLAVTVNVPAQPHAPDEATEDTDCIPTLYVFDIANGLTKTASIRLAWDQEDYVFWEHSYRGFAYDKVRKQLFLDNIEYSENARFCYTLLDENLNGLRCGKLDFPARSCYHTIAMNNGEVYLFGVRDIKEPNAEWHAFKRQITGQEWDYDFRMIYLNYCADINRQDFEPTQLICERDATCGWTTPLDCCYDQNGDMLLLVAAQNVFPAVMRERFFPDTPPESILEVYRFSKGRLICRTEICRSRDTELATGFNGFFHTAASGAVYLIWCKNMDLPGESLPQGTYLTPAATLAAPPIRLMDETGWLFGSKTRLGAFPSDTVDLYWPRLDRDIMHASFELSTYIK